MKNRLRSCASLINRAVRTFAEWLIQTGYKCGFLFFGRFPADQKLVIFESFFGRQYSCNPRAIYEYMRTHCPDYRLVWSADRRHEKMFAARHLMYVRRYSFRWLLLMSRAGYWVTNIRYPDWFRKPAHTVYVQTWHGTPLKKLALDLDSYPEKYKKQFIKDAAMWDILISPNTYSSRIFPHAFGFHGEMLETGYPRNDILYRKNNLPMIRRIREYCHIPEGKSVLLYAPTWRDDQNLGNEHYRYDPVLDLNAMKKAFGDRCVILLRLHYLVADQIDLSAFDGFALDVSHYEDISDLYLIADVLITDYSSVFFDYANLKRPMIFFAYDIDKYRDQLRGFYFDFEHEAPGPIVTTNEQLIETLRSVEKSAFTADRQFEGFYHRFCAFEDGHAAERVVRSVFHETSKARAHQ
ncbi:CDP-glycerol glycerophosphotransferase family protein [Sporolactobacillus vineae]|uniref:CDP-glycerol glycerophosphotransferase family protein n=1 Tax=Sporolactobacillus vineae TaxID=444463 RepID=UPI0002E65888|nr:CDP-glycerol glycerophosphotransferase family protein [Sporolactobacillus vineae]